jgi:hypothetical protein
MMIINITSLVPIQARRIRYLDRIKQFTILEITSSLAIQDPLSLH